MPSFLALREDPKWAEVSPETMKPSIQSSGDSRSEVKLRSRVSGAASNSVDPGWWAHPFLCPGGQGSLGRQCPSSQSPESLRPEPGEWGRCWDRQINHLKEPNNHISKLGALLLLNISGNPWFVISSLCPEKNPSYSHSSFFFSRWVSLRHKEVCL